MKTFLKINLELFYVSFSVLYGIISGDFVSFLNHYIGFVDLTIPVILFDIFTLIILSFLFHYMIGIPFVDKVKKEIDLYDRT